MIYDTREAPGLALGVAMCTAYECVYGMQDRDFIGTCDICHNTQAVIAEGKFIRNGGLEYRCQDCCDQRRQEKSNAS